MKDELVHYAQLKKYAEDLVALYRSEKSKSREVESTYKQLLSYAEELNGAALEMRKKMKAKIFLVFQGRSNGLN